MLSPTVIPDSVVILIFYKCRRNYYQPLKLLTSVIREYMGRMVACMDDAETLRYFQTMNEMLSGNFGIGVERHPERRVIGIPALERSESAQSLRSNARPRWVKISAKSNRIPNYVKRCPMNCKCSCHKTSVYPLGLNFQRVFKRLFPNIVEDPVLVRRCSELTCHATQASHRRLFVVVHSAFVNKAIVIAAISRGLKLKVQVKSYPVVPETSRIITFAQTGDTKNLKRFIMSGQATINDTAEDGWSLLHVSCEFNGKAVP
jgi:hypothetical protein